MSFWAIVGILIAALAIFFSLAFWLSDNGNHLEMYDAMYGGYEPFNEEENFKY